MRQVGYMRRLSIGAATCTLLLSLAAPAAQAGIEDRVAAVEAAVAALQAENSSQQAEIASLQANNAYLMDLLQHFSRVGNDVVITGANLQIVSGSGSTSGPVNGHGNLIIGYNETRGPGLDSRGGSHNIVVGDWLNYKSFGGIVLGEMNEISADEDDPQLPYDGYACVIGGWNNTASHYGSVVLSGEENKSAGFEAVVVGGFGNATSADSHHSTAVGGWYNEVSGWRGIAVGGEFNIVSGYASTVLGGQNNVTLPGGLRSTVLGGRNNTTNHSISTITGGYQVWSTGSDEWRAGDQDSGYFYAGP